jgi:hypothetical protein
MYYYNICNTLVVHYTVYSEQGCKGTGGRQQQQQVGNMSPTILVQCGHKSATMRGRGCLPTCLFCVHPHLHTHPHPHMHALVSEPPTTQPSPDAQNEHTDFACVFVLCMPWSLHTCHHLGLTMHARNKHTGLACVLSSLHMPLRG